MNDQKAIRTWLAIVAQAFILTIIGILPRDASGQSLSEFNALVQSSNYILLVKIISKPHPLYYLGTNSEVWARVIKDYRGNLPKIDKDTIPILMEDKCMDGQFIKTKGLVQNEEYVVFMLGTSLMRLRGNYYALIDSNLIARRMGKNDRAGFLFGKMIVSNRDFRNTIALINKKEKLEKRLQDELAVYRPSAANQYGFGRLWGAETGNRVYADGIYVSHWQTSCCKERAIFIYKNGHAKVLAHMDTTTVLKRVDRFLRKNKCNHQEAVECIKKVRHELTAGPNDDW
jgi:hypothetical protein